MDPSLTKNKLIRIYNRIITDMLRARKEKRIPKKRKNLEQRLKKAAEGQINISGNEHRYNLFSLPSFSSDGTPHALYRINPGDYWQDELGIIFLHKNLCPESFNLPSYNGEAFAPQRPEMVVYVWQTPHTEKLDRKVYMGNFNEPFQTRELLWVERGDWWTPPRLKKNRPFRVKYQNMPRTRFDKSNYRLDDQEMIEDLYELKPQGYDTHLKLYRWIIDCIYQRICPELYVSPNTKSQTKSGHAESQTESAQLEKLCQDQDPSFSYGNLFKGT